MPPIDRRRLTRIRRLVGDITAEQLRYVDWALARDVGVFVPVAGPCGYAIAVGHAHPAWSFIVPFDDRCRVRVDGRVIGSRPGQLCAIGPGVPHEELPGQELARYAAVFVSPRLLRRALAHHRLEALPPMRGARFAGTPEIVVAIREIMLEHAARFPGSEAIVDAAAVRLVHLVLRALLGVKRLPDRVPEREGLRRAAELADDRVDHPLTVRDLARAAGMSPFHFSREFKRETGHAPRAYLRRARLERAKRLLAADDRPVTEVALDCGFCSASHLATSFARAFRMPPSRYRAMLRRGRHRPQRR
jgi:AraC family transcriptional regulator